MNYRFLTKIGLLSMAFVLCLQISAFAKVTNKSNLAVQVEIKKTSGFSEKHTLFPGQVIALPSKAKSVTAISIAGRSRADEKLLVTILEANGNEGIIEKYDTTYTLGLSEDDIGDEPIIMKKGSAINKGNVAVNLILTSKHGFTQKRVLYLSQSITFAEDIVEVVVTSNIRMRGDEKLQVDITLPDGSAHTINRSGGIVKIAEE